VHPEGEEELYVILCKAQHVLIAYYYFIKIS
jgi:hypothetical protein